MIMFYPHDAIRFIALKTDFKGPEKLPQHFVDRVSISNATINSRKGIIVEIAFSRPIFGFIISVTMPTILMIMLSQMIQVFGSDYVDMVIQVQLTLILVLATL